MAGLERYLLVSPNCADLATPNFERKQFPDGESYIRIPQLDELEGKHVVFLHRIYPYQDRRIMQLLQVISIVEPVAAKVTAIVPYLSYARQDEAQHKGEALTADLLCKLSVNAGLDELVTFDCHFIKHPGKHVHAGLDIDHRTIMPELLEYVRPKAENPVIISPGEGGAIIAKKEGGIVMEKIRAEYTEGDVIIRATADEKLDYDLTGRDVILMDDMIAAGETMIAAARACKKAGARRVLCAAVHGLLVGYAFDKIRAAGVKEIVVSDSVPGPAAQVSIKSGLADYLQ
ncbi:MAG: ribose-phosphate diphosphokinase [Candidatus Micrarchaeota archaeon]|nr:ribose-phosphate diphosphokinase [Candidatus Micrarchaeota archaeon]